MLDGVRVVPHVLRAMLVMVVVFLLPVFSVPVLVSATFLSVGG